MKKSLLLLSLLCGMAQAATPSFQIGGNPETGKLMVWSGDLSTQYDFASTVSSAGATVNPDNSFSVTSTGWFCVDSWNGGEKKAPDGYNFNDTTLNIGVTLSSVETTADFTQLLYVGRTDSEGFALGFQNGEWMLTTNSSWWGNNCHFGTVTSTVATSGTHQLTFNIADNEGKTYVTVMDGETEIVSAIGDFSIDNGAKMLDVRFGAPKQTTVYSYDRVNSEGHSYTAVGTAATFTAPEPATATLSLLALAALAARRKRH